ncbi:protein F37C4.5-like [Watersipora subatra]|uniref:protein F37C4.5-like n=1 Tax=Watersipora subatra TaxID=2589382 RepID=UPI00355B3075
MVEIQMVDKMEVAHKYDVKDLNILTVKVYKDRAEVTRSIKASVSKGQAEILVEKLSSYCDLDSVRVEGKGNASITEVTSVEKLEEAPKMDESKVKCIQEQLADHKEQIRTLEAKQERIKKRKEVVLGLGAQVTTLASTKEQESPVNLFSDASLDGALKFMNFYGKQLRHCDNEAFRIDAELQEHSAKCILLEKHCQESSAPVNKNVRINRQVSVFLDVKEEGEISLALSYLVTEAAWRPQYDIRAFSADSLVKVTYFGLITQKTGEDWNNAKIFLSTAQPSVGGDMPLLPSQTVNLKSRTVKQFKGDQGWEQKQSAEREHYMKGTPPGSLGLVNESGWMNTEDFLKWIGQLISYTKSSADDPLLLIIDNYISHISPKVIRLAKEVRFHQQSFRMKFVPTQQHHRGKPTQTENEVKRKHSPTHLSKKLLKRATMQKSDKQNRSKKRKLQKKPIFESDSSNEDVDPVLLESDSEEAEPEEELLLLKKGVYVVVKYITKRTSSTFVGQVTALDREEDLVTVAFLKRKGTSFIHPDSKDIDVVTKSDIVKILHSPNTAGVTVALIDLKAAFEHFSAPKMVANAYLKAKLVNNSPYLILSGPCNIFMDNSFITKSRLPVVSPSESFECSLGVDFAVRVTYKSCEKMEATAGMLSKSKINEYKQVIEVKNTHQHDVTLHLEEQLPRSTNQKIKVNLVEPILPKDKDNKEGAPISMNSSGNIVWVSPITAGSTKLFLRHYTIESPRDMMIDFTNLRKSDN